MTGWLEASWWNVAAFIVPVLGASLAIRLALHKRPAPGKRPSPGPDAAGTPPPRAPAPGLTWVKTTFEADCGCVHILDAIARTRTKHECEWHKFATEWNEKLRRS